MFNLFASAGASSLVYAFLCATVREMKGPTISTQAFVERFFTVDLNP
jgi:hypothetical protein